MPKMLSYLDLVLILKIGSQQPEPSVSGSRAESAGTAAEVRERREKTNSNKHIKKKHNEGGRASRPATTPQRHMRACEHVRVEEWPCRGIANCGLRQIKRRI